MSSTSAVGSARLPGREAEVLALLGEYLSHAEIAGALFISVRTVESHVASLRRKLGVAGHRELVRLAAGQRAAAAGDVPAAVPRLPFPLTSFVGRESERAALAAAIGESRLVSAVGPGGVGKTRLALAATADVAGWFPGGTWYADLVPVTDPAQLTAAVLASIGVGESAARPAQEVLLAGVGDRRALLVLDNCEHLVNAVAVLTEQLLSACPNLAVLVTSRVRLVVPHESVFVVPGLSVPPADGDGGEAGEAGDAVVLFAERAAAAGTALPDGTSRRRATGICRALGGMPLAIELAAARLPSLGLDGLEAGLADQLSLLAGGSRQQQRHRSLHDTLDWSYQLLEPREQAVLRRVSVFAAPFSLAAAAAVAGFGPAGPAQVADALGRLAEHSLLAPAAGTGGTRYYALEPVRQFGLARLDAGGDEQARPRHLAWCLATAAELHQGNMPGPDWPQAFDAVSDDFRAALGWSAGQPRLRADACQLAAVLSGLLFARGRLREAQRRYEQTAALAGEQASAAIAFECAAAIAKIRTAGDEALRLDQAAADAYQQAGDDAAAAVALARGAEHVNRFAGMYADPPAPGTAGQLLAQARAHAAASPRAAAAISCAEAQDASLADAPGAPGAPGPAGAQDTSGDETAGAAGRALRLSRQAGDPLLISAALDSVMLEQVMRGDIVLAARVAEERIGVLPPLPHDPRPAFELKDALHTAIFTGAAAGQLARSLQRAEQHYGLPFLREERGLAGEDMLTLAAMVGQWERVVTLGHQWRRSWERAGRPVAPGRSLAPASVAMVHGLRGDDAARAGWLVILAAVRGVDEQLAVPGSGCGEVFEAIVLLHRGQPDAALDLLTADVAGGGWQHQLWRQWVTGLTAEAAVLARHPRAARYLTQARAAAPGNPVAMALTQRAEALLHGDQEALLTAAAGFTQASYPYQRARTLALAGGAQRGIGQQELAAMNAAPMTLSR